jgi:hypothetical protein
VYASHDLLAFLDVAHSERYKSSSKYYGQLSRLLGTRYGPLNTSGELINGQSDTPQQEDLPEFSAITTVDISRVRRSESKRNLLIQLLGLAMREKSKKVANILQILILLSSATVLNMELWIYL